MSDDKALIESQARLLEYYRDIVKDNSLTIEAAEERARKAEKQAKRVVAEIKEDYLTLRMKLMRTEEYRQPMYEGASYTAGDLLQDWFDGWDGGKCKADE